MPSAPRAPPPGAAAALGGARPAWAGDVAAGLDEGGYYDDAGNWIDTAGGEGAGEEAAYGAAEEEAAYGAAEEGEWIEQDDGAGNMYWLHTGSGETSWEQG